MLTIYGYQIGKTKIENLHHIKGCLNVKPYIPAVFVKPQFVSRFNVYSESDQFLYVPKHYGIQQFGMYEKSTRDVAQTPDKFWNFNGSIRDNQKEVVNSFLLPQPHDGIISLQTGGGKTVCALYIASQLKLPTVVLVHNTFLRDQWVERISAFLPNARIGRIQGEVVDIENKDIIVAMLQSLALKEYAVSPCHAIGLVIVDECHHIASESFSQAIPKLTSKYMLGLSATPERKDKLMYVINWFLGPLLYKSDSSDKVDGLVKVEYFEYEPEDPKFNDIILNPSGVMFTSLMINKVVQTQHRNKFIVEILSDVFSNQERQILVLSDRVDHTKAIFDLLPTEIQQKACILGREVKSEQRAEWCSTKRILIATYSMCKEGFDVATLNTLLMATSRPDIDQIVGRILRIEKDKRKVHPLILDIVDPPFRRQFQTRLQLYKNRDYMIEKTELIL
jgi:superfamily II DNA or RNA helicase